MTTTEAECKKIAKQLRRDRQWGRKTLATAKDHVKDARSAFAWAFTAPHNPRYIDGMAHRKRFNKLLAQLTAADEEKTA